MNLDTLDDFSRDFAKQLFAVYPHWALLAKFGRSHGDQLNHLIVEVPAPGGSDLGSTLLIHTDNNEVTVGFDCYHTHFFPQVVIPLNGDALDFIESILSEDIAAVSEWEGDTWRGSWTLERCEDDDLTEEQRPGWRIRVRSWNATRDRDLVGPMGREIES
jgi:hypothetical protein